MVSYLLIHIVGLAMEDSNLTEKFSQEDKIGERQLNFISLKSMNETQSKVSIIALTKRRKEMLAVQVSFTLSHLALLLFLAVKQLA